MLLNRFAKQIRDEKILPLIALVMGPAKPLIDV